MWNSYGKRKSTNTWLPKDWLKCTLPILENLGKNFVEDLRGSAFLLKYNGVIFVVTAKHVINCKNPRIAVPQSNKIWKSGSFQVFQERLAIKWTYHPEDSIDLAIIPFVSIPNLNVMPIEEQYWNVSPTIKSGDCITHLGYPDKQHANYSDGTVSFFAVEMPGEVVEKTENYILTRSAGLHGASGGPLFLKREGKYPFLIGVTIEAKMAKKNQYLYKTNSLSIKYILEILDSEEMKRQLKNLDNWTNG